MAVNDVGCGGAGLQYHCAPTDDGDIACSLADAQAACLAQGQRIVAIGDVPVFGHLGAYVSITIFRWFRAVEASALQECYRRLRSRCFEQKPFGIKWCGWTNGNHTGYRREPLFTTI